MNAIEVTNVKKEYPEFTMDNVSLTLPSGMILGLIGENGAGKTTLIKAMLGMIPIDGGTVSVLGCTTPHQNKKIMEDIGVVMDESGLPPYLNILQIGTMMKDIFHNWDTETFQSLVKKLKIPENTKVAELSRGNQMKAGIICALSHNPKLLILDEATSGLDPVIRDEVLDLLLDFTREEDHSILLSSHIVSDLEKVCDYIVFLHEGKVLLPFTAISGMGRTQATAFAKAYEERPFETVEDAAERGRVNKAIIEELRQHGVLEGLPETAQICMF